MIQIQEILDLSVEERISMIEKIWDSLDPASIEIPGTHQKELDIRLERYIKGETSFVTWESIKAELNTAR